MLINNDFDGIEISSKYNWLKYVESLKPLLGLSEWTFSVVEGNLDNDGAIAEIGVPYNVKEAQINLMDGFELKDPEEQRLALTHELLHCKTNYIKKFTKNITHFLSDVTQHLWQQTCDDAIEVITDDLSRIIAPYLPLP